jgi:thiosulfate reductase cytochrome b subunit
MLADNLPVSNNSPSAILYYRHRLPVRIMHWINVICLFILLMSGLGIFNAHPSLYWGISSYSARPALLVIGSKTVPNASMAGAPSQAGATTKKGILRVFGHEFDTTGVLGVSTDANGLTSVHAFPSWLTIPGSYSLADSRLWHFFFAWLFVINGLLYVLYSFLSGHFRRDMTPDAKDLRGIGASIKDHIRFKHPEGEAARRYNVLQKLTYLIVIFVLLPLIILMGMAMSPMLDSLLTGWVDWFGGRQSARTIHFVVAWLLVAFVLIHVFEVIVSGLWNHLRSMITGYYAIKSEPIKGDAS